jgi:DNA-binding NarL/FixJ family response regulator
MTTLAATASAGAGSGRTRDTFGVGRPQGPPGPSGRGSRRHGSVPSGRRLRGAARARPLPEHSSSEEIAAIVRVLVVDGHPLSRVALSSLLRSVGFDVVGEANNAVTAAAMGRRLSPDVALIDLDQLETSGVEAVRLIAASSPPSRVVAMTTAAQQQDVIGTLAAGACAYILKGRPTREVVAAVHEAAAGESVLSPAIASTLVHWLRLQSADASSPPALTPREVEVLELLVRGWDNARIAAALYLSRGTVKHHISSIFTKLGVANRIQAAVVAVEQGLLDR